MKKLKEILIFFCSGGRKRSYRIHGFTFEECGIFWVKIVIIFIKINMTIVNQSRLEDICLDKPTHL